MIPDFGYINFSPLTVSTQDLLRSIILAYLPRAPHITGANENDPGSVKHNCNLAHNTGINRINQ